jgi:hypothetical protein
MAKPVAFTMDIARAFQSSFGGWGCGAHGLEVRELRILRLRVLGFVVLGLEILGLETRVAVPIVDTVATGAQVHGLGILDLGFHGLRLGWQLQFWTLHALGPGVSWQLQP